MREKHLTPNDLAERWGVSIGTLANHRYQGMGVPYLRIGGRVLYRLRDVEAFEDASVIRTAAA